MKLIVSVVGCRKRIDRFEAIRATWASRQVDGAAVHYFVGAGRAPVPDWVDVLDAPDGYSALPIKMHRMHEWLRHREFDWVFKCDDDTYLVIERLLAELPSLTPSQFLGAAAGFPKYASGGAGYLMHREASNRLADDPVPSPGAEDVHYSARLIALGYAFKKTWRLHDNFLPVERPKPHNDSISCHGCDPAMLRCVHEGYFTRTLEMYRAVHPMWRSHFALLEDGHFIGGGAYPDGNWQVLGDRLHIRWYSWPEEVLHRSDSGWKGDWLRLERVVEKT